MKRPLAITIIGWLFILAGTVGFVYHVNDLNTQDPFANDAIWILLVRFLAVVGGVLTLRGYNTGRWLLTAWMAYHVGLSFFHPLQELIVHVLFLILTVLPLFLPKWAVYFRRPSPR